MGSCTRRHFMLSTCLLQMITIIERQVFDFLGYMWAPILVNFFHIIFIILGFYGAYHFRIKYIITYLIWSFIWIGWNAFLICFYLNVGILDRDSDLLNLGTGSVSWFEVNGYGCKPTYPVNITSDDPFRPIRPERVDDCLLDYTIVEIVQSGVQCALALLGILGAILISYIFLDEDDRFDFVNGDAKSPQHTVVHPMYVSYSSIPTSASASATLLSNKHHNNHQAPLNNNNHNHQIHAQQQQLQLQQQQLHHHQQPNNFNSNTFLIHTNSISNNSHSHSHSQGQSQRQSHSHSQSNSRSRSHSRSNSQSGGNGVGVGGGGGGGGGASKKGRGGGDGNSNYHSASKNSTLTRILYSPKSSNKIGATTGNTIVVATEMLQRQQSLPQTHTANLHGAQHYYDDSTAKADQLYTNSNRRQFLNGTTTYQQQQQVGTPNSSTHDNTTSSLSYASLQNSNLNLTQSLRGVGGGAAPGVGFGYAGSGGGSVGGSRSGGGGVGGHMGGGGRSVGASVGGGSVGGYGRVAGVGGGMTSASSQATLSPLSNSQFSLSNSLNNNYSNHSGNNNNNNINNNIVLSNPANYMNNNNNNGSMGSGVGGGHFARIHAKPKPPKSTSYSSFINNGSGAASLNGSSAGTGTGTGGSMTNVHRPDIKYTQMSNERLSRNLEEGLEDDNFSLQNFKTDDGVTYVPFQKPTPGALFVGQNNNPSYVSLNSYAGAQMSPNNNNNNNNASPNTINNNALPQFARSISQLAPPPPLPENGGGGEILLERGAVLQPAYNYPPPPQASQQMLMHSPGPPHMQQQQQQLQQSAHVVSGAQTQHSPQPLLNPANRFLYQQNGLPFHPAYNKPIPVPPPVPTHTSPPMSAPYQSHLMSPVAKQPPRPTNIPLPTIPAHSFDTPISPSEVTPPPPPAPRPHIFQPRSGHAPYPDLSPEVTEKYAMPTQYVPRSPVASRIARRQRQQQQQQSHNYHHHQPAQPAAHHVNTSANFCDQVRDAPPGYIVDAGFSIVRAKSYDRLASASSTTSSMRRDAKAVDAPTQSQQQQAQVNAEAAPHVNRRSGRRDAAGRVRPRSYCNSMSGGEGVIRGSLVYERDFAVQSGVVATSGTDGVGGGGGGGCVSGGNGGSGVVEGGGNVGGDQLA